MRLSEAIRLGALLHPQAFGEFIDSDGATCALGAAGQAIGQSFDNDMDEVWNIWRWTEERHFPCPVPHCKIIHGDWTTFAHIIAELNDDHEWTRERIADWVATVEPVGDSSEQPEAVDAVARTRDWVTG